MLMIKISYTFGKSKLLVYEIEFYDYTNYV